MSADIQPVTSVLSEAVFAAYLLGYDAARDENLAKIDFAEGDPIDLSFDVPPQEAIEYFKRKKIVSKDEFMKLEAKAKAGAFTVGQIYEEDLLEAFKSEITDALQKGRTQREVIGRFKEILKGAGHKMLGNYHLESVFRTNMQMAYGVGRRRSMEDVADLLPFWEYSAVNDDRTRPKHRALDGIIYPANHVFWDTHYPPIDFMCRCTVVALPDTPEGYDHERPNADTTIVYDENGIPDKAEYLTQVVDLKATKFNGVPKMANLEKALKEAAKRSKSSRKKK